MRNLLDPREPRLAINLCSGLKGAHTFQRRRLRNDLIFGRHLPVVHVDTTRLAKVAVHVLAGVALVDVVRELAFALGDLQVGLGDDLIQREGGAGGDFAGVAVAVCSKRQDQ